MTSDSSPTEQAPETPRSPRQPVQPAASDDVAEEDAKAGLAAALKRQQAREEVLSKADATSAGLAPGQG